MKRFAIVILLAPCFVVFCATAARSDSSCSTVQQWYEGAPVGDQNAVAVAIMGHDPDGFTASATAMSGYQLTYVKLVWLVDGTPAPVVELTLDPPRTSWSQSEANATFQYFEATACGVCLGTPPTAPGSTGTTQPEPSCAQGSTTSTVANVAPSSTASPTTTPASTTTHQLTSSSTQVVVATPRFTG